MKILASFLILITFCSFAFCENSMKSSNEKSTKSNTEVQSKVKSETNKADPGAILPAAAVLYLI